MNLKFSAVFLLSAISIQNGYGAASAGQNSTSTAFNTWGDRSITVSPLTPVAEIDDASKFAPAAPIVIPVTAPTSKGWAGTFLTGLKSASTALSRVRATTKGPLSTLIGYKSVDNAQSFLDTLPIEKKKSKEDNVERTKAQRYVNNAARELQDDLGKAVKGFIEELEKTRWKITFLQGLAARQNTINRTDETISSSSIAQLKVIFKNLEQLENFIKNVVFEHDPLMVRTIFDTLYGINLADTMKRSSNSFDDDVNLEHN